MARHLGYGGLANTNSDADYSGKAQNLFSGLYGEFLLIGTGSHSFILAVVTALATGAMT